MITPGGLLLCNESFAATNEREGSEIARQIIRALPDAGIKVVFVTHLYDLADSFYTRYAGKAPVPARRAAARRAADLPAPEGEPLPTSYGEDLYRQVFGPAYEARPSEESDMDVEVVIEIPQGWRNKYEMDHKPGGSGSTGCCSPPRVSAGLRVHSRHAGRGR